MNTEQPLLNQRYKLLTPLGAGGMAVVYKAQDLSLGRLVAVKMLRETLIHDAEFLSRFQQEARAAANLSHPNIVTVHDFGRDGGRYYIVMEYVEGQDLKAIIKEQAPLKIEAMLDYAIQICAGIGYAHRAGLVHCDVKPQNLLVTQDGRVKITDFGIARALATLKVGETTDVVWGSPQYYSPEQAAGEAPAPASDVYSIGVVMYEMLAGRLPFVASTQQALAMMHLRDEPPSLSLFNPHMPPTLERIVHKVLAKEPAARYRTADQLGRILMTYRKEGEAWTSAQAQSPARRPAAPQPPTGETEVDEEPLAPAPYPPPLRPTPPLRPAQRPATQPTAPAEVVAAAPQAGNDVYTDNGVDWMEVGLTFLAFIAVVGLIPFWIVVIAHYLGFV